MKQLKENWVLLVAIAVIVVVAVAAVLSQTKLRPVQDKDGKDTTTLKPVIGLGAQKTV